MAEAARSGLGILRQKLRERPWQAARDLALDYATWVGMVAFTGTLVLLRAPIAVAEQASGRPLRQKFIDLVSRAAKA